MTRPGQDRHREAGFTLLEVLAGLMLASLILVSLNMAMRAVGKGVDHARQSLGEQAEIAGAVEIFGRDVARIAKIRRGSGAQAAIGYLFDGRADEMIYPLREDAGLDAPGLYLVRLSLRQDEGARQLLRERVPLAEAMGTAGATRWRDAVVLLSGDFDIAFAYRAQRSGLREWASSWPGGETMPEQIRLTIADPATGKLRMPGFVQSLAIDLEVDCAGSDELRCGGPRPQAATQ